MFRAALLIALVFSLLSFTSNAQDSRPRSFPCFTAHGRYAIYSGDGQVELWIIGTHRLLRPVKGDETLQEKLRGVENEKALYGDFTICPLEKDTAGAMRNVAIKGWTNLRFGPPSHRQSGTD